MLRRSVALQSNNLNRPSSSPLAAPASASSARCRHVSAICKSSTFSPLFGAACASVRHSLAYRRYRSIESMQGPSSHISQLRKCPPGKTHWQLYCSDKGSDHLGEMYRNVGFPSTLFHKRNLFPRSEAIPMKDSIKFRRYAEECRRLANQMKPEHKATLLEIAEAWDRCAEEAARGVVKDSDDPAEEPLPCSTSGTRSGTGWAPPATDKSCA